MVWAAASWSQIKEENGIVWIGLCFPTAHADIWMSFEKIQGSRSWITSFFVEAPRCRDLKQKNWISRKSGRERWLFAKIQEFIFPEFYWVLLYWRREMAASFRQTALSAMTGDGWMLIWIILKVESDTFWLLWFSKILTEMPTKMGITFSFTFKLCHGGPPEAGLPLTPAHHTIWPLVRDNWINLAGLVSKYWACFKRYLCPHRGFFPTSYS